MGHRGDSQGPAPTPGGRVRDKGAMGKPSVAVVRPGGIVDMSAGLEQESEV